MKTFYAICEKGNSGELTILCRHIYSTRKEAHQVADFRKFEPESYTIRAVNLRFTSEDQPCKS